MMPNNSMSLHQFPSFPASLQGSISKSSVQTALPPGIFSHLGFFGGAAPFGGPGGPMPDFGANFDRGSFPFFGGATALSGLGMSTNPNINPANAAYKSTSFERSPNSSFVRYSKQQP